MVVGELTQEIDLVVIGGGPGGYVAALAAADRGIQTALIEEAKVPGGVCLREGCIPSKSLLHVARIVDEAKHAESMGLTYAPPKLDIEKLRGWKNGVIRKLAGGVQSLIKARKIDYFNGHAEFESSNIVRLEGVDNARLKFRHAIIATGASAKFLPESLIPRELCWSAADALEVSEVPKRLLIIGGGYIGLEIGQVYAGLGSEVTVVEALDGVLTGLDPELAKPLLSKLSKQMKAIHTGAQFKGAKKSGKDIQATYVVGGKEVSEPFDRILVSIGRRPRTDGLGLEHTKVSLSDRGFIQVDHQFRTTDKRIFAIGDVIGDPMLAHKASREAKIVANVLAGKNDQWDNVTIPAVVYTDPEVAWCGYTEAEAKAKGLDFVVKKFQWVGSGRAVSMNRAEGLTKLIFDRQTQRLIGMGIVGAHAGDLLMEGVLGMEVGAVADDLALSIHPHPSLGETIMEAAEAMTGKAIHGH